MGTRCDFYAGRGLEATYLGSIGHDAFPDAMALRFAGVTDRAAFDERLRAVFAEFGEIPARNGWPWPWRSSDTTDVVVAFDAGRCWVSHPSGCWALLDDFENATDEPCEFADMIEILESTPQGRLVLRLRHGTDMRRGPPDAVMAYLLCYVGTLLSEMLLHGFWKEGCFHVQESYSSEWHGFELKRVAAAINSVPEDFEMLMAECAKTMGDDPWELLSWLREAQGHLETESLKLTVSPDLPVYFGVAAPVSEHGQELSYVKFTDKHFSRVYALWQKLADRAPLTYAQAMANAMIDFSVLPVPRAEAVAWLSKGRAEFGDTHLVAACASAEGRERVRAWAGLRLFKD